MMYPNGVVKLRPCDRWEEAEWRLELLTEDGLRARTFFNDDNHPKYKLYTTGERNYAVAGFVVWTYLRTGEMPHVYDVDSPGGTLNWTRR